MEPVLIFPVKKSLTHLDYIYIEKTADIDRVTGVLASDSGGQNIDPKKSHNEQGMRVTK